MNSRVYEITRKTWKHCRKLNEIHLWPQFLHLQNEEQLSSLDHCGENVRDTCKVPRTMKAQSAQARERIFLLLFNLSYRDSKTAGDFLKSYEKCLCTSLMKEMGMSSDFQNRYVCACQVVLVVSASVRPYGL